MSYPSLHAARPVVVLSRCLPEIQLRGNPCWSRIMEGHSLNGMSSFTPSSSPSESIGTSRTTPSPSPPPPLVAPPPVVATPSVPPFPPLLLILEEEEEEGCSNKRKNNSSMVWYYFIKMKNVDEIMRWFNYVMQFNRKCSF
ncbi:hypothetical protein ACLB2K_064004 [Fragaria x ananassa]